MAQQTSPATIQRSNDPIREKKNSIKLSLQRKPAKSEDLLQILENAATTQAGVTTYPPAQHSSIRTSYRELLARAKTKARLLHNIDGLSSDSVVLLHFDEHIDNIEWFWAVAIAGYVPAISTPLVNDLDQRKRHLLHLHNLFSSPTILTRQKLIPEFVRLDELNICSTESLKSSKDQGRLRNNEIEAENDLAALMLTSGSTGNAKAVSLSHRQIIAAARAKSKHNGTTKDDIFLNWIGMDHVVNLVECHIQAMDIGAEQVHIQAADLLLKPLRFIHLIHEHRVSFTFAPNFFLALVRRVLDGDGTNFPSKSDVDLSSLRGLLSGGEANVVATCAALAEHLSSLGAKSNVIRPGYGLTETCAGIIWGSAFPSYDLDRGHEFASVGPCLPDGHMRVIKDDGNKAAPKEIGNLQLSGPMVFKEYYRNSAATADAFTEDGWFISGDRALIDDEGNLNLAGRAKEVIIINGVNYSPHEVETALEDIPGISPSYTVVFPHRPQGSETEKLCVIYLPNYDPEDIKARADTAEAITRACGNNIGARPHQILPLPKFFFSKSSVGKLPRKKVQSSYESGAYHKIQIENNNAIRSYRVNTRQAPCTKSEQSVLKILCEMFYLSSDGIGTDANIFELGVTSIGLFALRNMSKKRWLYKRRYP